MAVLFVANWCSSGWGGYVPSCSHHYPTGTSFRSNSLQSLYIALLRPPPLKQARVLSRVADRRRLLVSRQKVAREKRNSPRRSNRCGEKGCGHAHPFFNRIHQLLARHHLVPLTLALCSLEFGVNNVNPFVAVAVDRVILLHSNCHEGRNTTPST